MKFAQCLLGINFLWLFAVFKMAEICERSERATENKKKRLASEEILNFLDVGSSVVIDPLLIQQ